jgi:hypothetical protein
MGAYFLAALVWCGCVAEQDELLQQLDDDFEALLKAEKDPQPIRKASLLLEQTNESDRWMQYMEALTILQQGRSKAAIPLLLKYMVLHSGLSIGPGAIAAYADTLCILTGKDVPNPYRYVADRKAPVRERVEDLVKTWWTPSKEKLSTDMGKMSREQLQVVVHRLSAQVERADRRRQGGESASQFAYAIGAAMSREREDRRIDWPQNLHPAMVPLLLEQSGYVENPPEKAQERDTARISLTIVSMLAELHRNHEAPGLEKVAGDKRQNSAVRLTCLLALAAAGEDLKTGEVLDALSKETKVPRRIVAILALEYSGEQKLAVPVLFKYLDDANRDVREAAVLALRTSKPKEALPKLKKILEEVRPRDPVSSALQLVASIRSKASQKILADFLQATLKEDKKATYLYQALHAFEQATDQRWTNAGANPESHYRDAARQALEWWAQQDQ